MEQFTEGFPKHKPRQMFSLSEGNSLKMQRMLSCLALARCALLRSYGLGSVQNIWSIIRQNLHGCLTNHYNCKASYQAEVAASVCAPSAGRDLTAQTEFGQRYNVSDRKMKPFWDYVLSLRPIDTPTHKSILIFMNEYVYIPHEYVYHHLG